MRGCVDEVDMLHGEILLAWDRAQQRVNMLAAHVRDRSAVGANPSRREMGELEVLRGPLGLRLWVHVKSSLETVMKGERPDEPTKWQIIPQFIDAEE